MWFEELVVVWAEACLGFVSNLILIVTLSRTWKQWRQVKHYVVFLIVSNMLEVTFSHGVYIARSVFKAWNVSDFFCKFLMVSRYLGPFGISMAVAALAAHVLLTSVTGNQGSRLRHGLVIGLFVLMSLIMPIAEIWLHKVKRAGFDRESLPVYVEFNVSASEEQIVDYYCIAGATEEQTLDYYIAGGVLWIFLPVGIVVATLATALTLNRCRRSVSGDTHSSDLVLAGLLGFVLTLCCAPYYGLMLYDYVVHPAASTQTISDDVFLFLLSLVGGKSTINAWVCVVFCYCFLKSRGGAEVPYMEYASPSVRESCERGEAEVLGD